MQKKNQGFSPALKQKSVSAEVPLVGQKRQKHEVITKEPVKKEEALPTERAAFLRSNEVEKAKLDREIAMLERKLGIKKDSKKRRKLN